MNTIRFLLSFLVCLNVILSADLHIGEIERMLEEERFANDDRSFIDSALSLAETPPFSDHPLNAWTQSHQQELSQAESGSSSSRAQTVQPLYQQYKEQLRRYGLDSSRERVKVRLPSLLPTMSVEERRKELEELSQRFRSLGKRLPPRSVLPLIIKNPSLGYYKHAYFQILNTNSPRFLWRPESTTYLLSKPNRFQDGFHQLHGRIALAKENVWAVWRLEEYGDAKVWRYLGSMELPSHHTAKKIMLAKMQLLLQSSREPKVFFNGAAHLDPSQTLAGWAGSAR